MGGSTGHRARQAAARPAGLEQPDSKHVAEPDPRHVSVGVMRSEPPAQLRLVCESQMGSSLLSGIVTFLFTDIQASTRLWQQYHSEMREVLMRHDALIEALVVEHDGTVVRALVHGCRARGG